MNPFEPPVRRRGYFLDTDSPDESSEDESAEGVTLRIRIVKSLPKRLVVAARAPDRPAPGRRHHPGKRRLSNASDRR